MLDDILNSCNYVVNNSKHVIIDYKKIDSFIESIDCKMLKHWLSNSIVKNKMNGNFYEYIKNVKDDTQLFDIIISNFSSFKDERIYNGRKVYFYKLAQLLASNILHLREMIENIKVDYSHLVGCVDYKIPQTMRALEILKYDIELSKLIDNRAEINFSSEYEVEIRASMIVVIDYIKNKLKNIKAIDINDYFFTASKSLKEISKPYHLCKNTNY